MTASWGLGLWFWRVSDLDLGLSLALVSTQGWRAMVSQLRKVEGVARGSRELGSILREAKCRILSADTATQGSASLVELGMYLMVTNIQNKNY